MSDKPSFFAELKRRNVVRMAGLYLVGAWLLTQVASTVLPMFGAPDWLPRSIVILLAIGFLPTLIFSWAFELTPQGLKRDEDVAPEQSIAPKTARRMDRMIIVVLVLALGYFAVDKFVLMPRREAALVSSAVPNESKSVINAKSIAVLPFENLSSDKENAYFTDGVQDEILTDLARIADLKVISRTSVMQYKDAAKRNLPDIAQALKVAHVLEGSVQRAEHRVRVTAQLIDARTDAHLWAQRYDGDLSDVFAIQSEIAQKIADQLQAVLSPKERTAIADKPTTDLAAYDLYLRAVQLEHGTKADPDLRERFRLLEDATARDPSFVPALCALARAHLHMYWFNLDHTDARLAQAKKAIDAAERLKPDAGEVHVAKALLHYWGSRDYEAALSELRRARTSLPNDASVLFVTGTIERRLGHFEEVVRDFEDSLKLDPQNGLIVSELAGSYLFAKRYPDALRVLDEALRWNPTDLKFAAIRAEVNYESTADLRPLEALLAGELVKTGDPDFVASFQIGLALFRRDYAAAQKALAGYKAPYFGGYPGYKVPREMTEGIIARQLGDSKKAETAFLAARARAAANVAAQPDDAKPLAVLGEVDAFLGRKDEAIREGERAAELLPVARDAVDGPLILTYLAEIYAQTGQPDRALDVLERVAPMNWGPHYGDLKLDMTWDPLRGNPRFEKIIASLAPKSAK